MLSGKLLVANRGEIAIRICRAAAEVGLETVAVFPVDDAASLHTRKADVAHQLPGRGVAAYLDIEAVIAAARATGAKAIHPGYGFLSENAAFARRCAEAGITFVGPSPESLERFGDKHAARKLAQSLGVPTLPGTAAPTSVVDARAFLRSLGDGGAVMVKAVAGGGGRGMRPVRIESELGEAFARCSSEAQSGFGNGDLYVERLIRRARHIEVQVIGDGRAVSHLWERDCSLQRRRQKIVEIAPAPGLDGKVRDKLIDAALKLAGAVHYRNLGTVEFLVDADTGEHFFIEANPRLQVEHTVTEEVTGLDLVELQLRIAGGATLAELGLTRDRIPQPRGMALQARINLESIAADGTVKPGGGTLTAFDVPSGRGIRVDGNGYVGYRTSAAYDPLLAKLVVHTGTPKLGDVLGKAYRALCEMHVEGVPTNIALLQALFTDEAVRAGRIDTEFVETNAVALAARANTGQRPHLYFAPPAATLTATPAESTRQPSAGRAGARIDAVDPLAVLAYGQGTRTNDTGARPDEAALPDGMLAVRAPLQGTIVSLAVEAGTVVHRGAQLAIMEAMKMEHVVVAQASGIVREMHAAPGDTIWEDQLLLTLEPAEGADAAAVESDKVDIDRIRPDLAEMLARRALTRDDKRPDAFTDCHHVSRTFTTDRAGVAGIGAEDVQHVLEIESGGGNTNHHLTGRRHRNFTRLDCQGIDGPACARLDAVDSREGGRCVRCMRDTCDVALSVAQHDLLLRGASQQFGHQRVDIRWGWCRRQIDATRAQLRMFELQRAHDAPQWCGFECRRVIGGGYSRAASRHKPEAR